MNQNLKVLELRNYLLKPKTRERFVDYFENHFVESQKSLGGYVLGQFTVKGEDDNFFWMRGFENMRSRLGFLRDFYEKGEVWKRRGAGANEMMLDSDNVYLLKPLNGESFDGNEIAKQKEIVVVNFYFSKDKQLEKLTDFCQTNFVPLLKNKPTLWISEMSENDFPRLPVFQDENLLVAVTNFANESDYQDQTKQYAELKNQMTEFLARENSLILYPTDKTWTKNARDDNGAATDEHSAERQNKSGEKIRHRSNSAILRAI